MKRNLRFWTRYTWESASVELGLVALIAVLGLLGAESIQWELLASTLPYYLIFTAIVAIIFINFGCHTVYIPLLISLGETRRNILIGFHYYRCLVIAVTLGLCAALWALVPCETSSVGLKCIPTILACLVIASSIGSLMGTACAKWKWISVAILLVICGGVGGSVGFLFSGGRMAELGECLFLAVAALDSLLWWLAAAALALLLLDTGFQWLLLRRQEVKL